MKPSSLIRTALTLFAAALIPALSSCETTKGIGRDVKKAGTGIERTASEVQHSH